MWLFRQSVLAKALQRRHYTKTLPLQWIRRFWDRLLPPPPPRRCWDKPLPLPPPSVPPTEAITLEYLDHLPKPSKEFDKLIEAIPRRFSGKGTNSRMRWEGFITGTIFDLEDIRLGGNERIILLQKKTMNDLITSMGRFFFCSRLFDIEVRPAFNSKVILEKSRVLPRMVSQNRKLGLLDITFLRAHPGTLVRVEVPFNFLGKDTCLDRNKGKHLNILHGKCPFLCPVEIIPPYIQVDISNLKVGQTLRFGSIEFHPALKLLKPVNFPFLKLEDEPIVRTSWGIRSW